MRMMPWKRQHDESQCHLPLPQKHGQRPQVYEGSQHVPCLAWPRAVNTTMKVGQQGCKSPLAPQTRHSVSHREGKSQPTTPVSGNREHGLQHHSPFGTCARSCRIGGRPPAVLLMENLLGSVLMSKLHSKLHGNTYSSLKTE